MKRVLSLAFVSVVSFGLSAAQGAGDASYAIKYEVPPAKKGQRAVVKVKLAPGAGYHMNKEFPTALSMVPPGGVNLEKAKLTAKDAARFEETGAEFEVALVAADAGSKVVTGELKFAVCSATTCDPKREKVSFTVEVK
jgi:hypothetical protein